jgi:hypothetical protein
MLLKVFHVITPYSLMICIKGTYNFPVHFGTASTFLNPTHYYNPSCTSPNFLHQSAARRHYSELEEALIICNFSAMIFLGKKKFVPKKEKGRIV